MNTLDAGTGRSPDASELTHPSSKPNLETTLMTRRETAAEKDTTCTPQNLTWPSREQRRMTSAELPRLPR